MVRRPIEDAKKLLAEAGYPDGRDAKTGQPLVLNYDYQKVVTPEGKVENDWMVRQFAKLGIQLEIRATDYNQFQDKVLKGKHQIYWWGWLADYPDAENFLFLLYGPNSKSVSQGENTSNYQNPEYDKLYRELKTLDDGPRKQEVIDKMVAILQNDAPWSFGYFPWGGLAFQQWVYNGKPSILIRDMAKYYRVDPALRVAKQAEWNKPVWWPMVLLAARAARPRLERPPRLPRAPARHRRAGAASGPGVGRRHERLTAAVLNYLVRRVGYGVLILIGVNLFTFFLFFNVNTPDDMARLNIGGKRVTQAQIDKWKAERGYDKPLYWNAAESGTAKATDDGPLAALDLALRARLRPLGFRAQRRHRPRDQDAHVGQRAAGGAGLHPAGDREHLVRAAADLLPPLADRLLGRRRCAC